MAEIKVPAWPIPIHQTKLTMANPHPMGMVTPQMPMPFRNEVADGVEQHHGQHEGDAEAEEPSVGGGTGQHDGADFFRDRAEGVAGLDYGGALEIG